MQKEQRHKFNGKSIKFKPAIGKEVTLSGNQDEVCDLSGIQMASDTNSSHAGCARQLMLHLPSKGKEGHPILDLQKLKLAAKQVEIKTPSCNDTSITSGSGKSKSFKISKQKFQSAIEMASKSPEGRVKTRVQQNALSTGLLAELALSQEQEPECKVNR